MDIFFLYQSPNGNIFTCRQLLDEPQRVHVNDRNQPDLNRTAGGVEIVLANGDILYLSIEFPNLQTVARFFIRSIGWLKRNTSAMPVDSLNLLENNETYFSIKKAPKGALLSLTTFSLEKERDFEGHFVSSEEWISAATRAVDECFGVFKPAQRLVKFWTALKNEKTEASFQ